MTPTATPMPMPIPAPVVRPSLLLDVFVFVGDGVGGAEEEDEGLELSANAALALGSIVVVGAVAEESPYEGVALSYCSTLNPAVFNLVPVVDRSDISKWQSAAAPKFRRTLWEPVWLTMMLYSKI